MLCRLFCIACVITSPVVLAADEPGREQALLDRIEQLEQRVARLEQRLAAASAPPALSSPPQQVAAAPVPAAPLTDVLQGTAVNFQVDGYYGYNFNAPIGRANLLRAYDVLSNAFSLNQASLVVENAPDLSKGKRYGARLDLQWGQATETLQGNSVNEPRPDIYRAIFQVYGTYIFPLGNGLTVDFGKWASSLGIEGNYTKDQVNYSRSLWFAYLPFYHMGARAAYKVNDHLTLNYWMINGTQQTEPFNGYKDQLVGFTAQPRKSVTWNVNYYRGQEHPDVTFYPNAPSGSLPPLPTLQGVPFQPIMGAPQGRMDIVDTYAAIQASPKLYFALEGDYVDSRLLRNSSPQFTFGGSGYLRYQLLPRVALGARAEYLADHDGLFSGIPQVLREATLTSEYKVADGFLARLEYRRDFSNHGYFLTDTLGLLQKHQTTATVGLVWWFGPKTGVW